MIGKRFLNRTYIFIVLFKFKYKNLHSVGDNRQNIVGKNSFKYQLKKGNEHTIKGKGNKFDQQELQNIVLIHF